MQTTQRCDSKQAMIGLLVACLVITTSSDSVTACKWCPPEVGPTILRQLEASESAILAKLIQRADPNADNPTCKYRVVAVLKGTLAGDGDEFTVPLDVQSAVGAVHLFFSETESKSWKNPLGVSTEARRFIAQAARLPEPGEDLRSDNRTKRLAFMLPYLESTDQQVALAAHGEFSSTPYSAFQELRTQLDHRQLVSWIESETTLEFNRGHLFTLLGICGNQYDYFVVAEALDQSLANGETVNLDAMMTTYLMLGRQPAFMQIQHRLLSPETPLSAKRAAVEALRFHAESEMILNKQQIIEVYRKLLEDPKTADYVIADLARWKDWKSLDQVLALWKTRKRNRWLKYPILEYLNACPLPEAKHAVQLASSRQAKKPSSRP